MLLLSASPNDSVRSAVLALLPPGDALESLELVQGAGFSNGIWTVLTNTHSYVFRARMQKMDPQQFDRVVQIANIAASQGLGPRYTGIHTPSQQALIERIDPMPWPLYTTDSLPYHTAMRALRAFHGATKQLNLQSDPAPDPFHWMQDATQLNADFVPSQMVEAAQRCSEVFRALKPFLEQYFVMCHGDYTKSNVLLTKDRRPMLVDFDSAAVGDPFFDVVKFSITLPASCREELLKTYLGDRDPSPKERARYELMDLALLMVVAKVRFGSAQRMLTIGTPALSKQETEELCRSKEPLPSFLSVPFSDQSVKSRQTGAVYALHEFLRRTQKTPLHTLVETIQNAD